MVMDRCENRRTAKHNTKDLPGPRSFQLRCLHAQQMTGDRCMQIPPSPSTLNDPISQSCTETLKQHSHKMSTHTGLSPLNKPHKAKINKRIRDPSFHFFFLTFFLSRL